MRSQLAPTRSSRREGALIPLDFRLWTLDFRVSLLPSAATRVLLCLALGLWAGGRLPAQEAARVRFSSVDLFVDSGAQPLAAYQLIFTATRGDVKIVGIEGGEHPSFKEAPYYDPLAIQQERAILAAFNTAAEDQLPKGRTRVATVHVQIRGTEAPSYTVKFETAANHEGAAVTARTSFQERSTK
jgi:hypothetical protein